MKITYDRFRTKYEIDSETGCWNWLASRTKDGYGQFGHRINGIYSPSAHRYSWQIHRGKIPSSLDVCHTCDNPGCVNPDHLWLGTRSENMQDAIKKGRFIPLWSRKLTMADAEKIRELYVKGGDHTMQSLATLYSVSKNAINQILHRTTYRT